VSNVTTRTLIGTYTFRTANKTLPPLRISVSANPWHPFAELIWRNTARLSDKVATSFWFYTATVKLKPNYEGKVIPLT